MDLKRIVENIVLEASDERMKKIALQSSGIKPIANAIINRHPISFFYSGPKPQVLAGKRINARAVALGPSAKNGKLLIRAWVDNPSKSKRGTPTNVGDEKANYGWRTFYVSRMSRVQVDNNTVFDQPNDKYNPNGDKHISLIYAQTDFNNEPEEITPVVKQKKEKKPTTTPPTTVTPPPTAPKPTVAKQTKVADQDLKNTDAELTRINNDIQTNLAAYKNAKGTPEEKQYVDALKQLGQAKNDTIKKMDDLVAGLGQDVQNTGDIKKYVDRTSAEKNTATEPIVPNKPAKPSKLPNQQQTPTPEPTEPVNNELPQVPKNKKPSKTPNNGTEPLNEGFINRIKKLIGKLDYL
jgi:hypothetical protein